MIATIGRKDYEIAQEHTKGSVTFTELEYENVSLDGKVYADEHYLFVGNELVAIRVCFDHGMVTFDETVERMFKMFGEAADVDLAVLLHRDPSLHVFKYSRMAEIISFAFRYCSSASCFETSVSLGVDVGILSIWIVGTAVFTRATFPNKRRSPPEDDFRSRANICFHFDNKGFSCYHRPNTV